MPATTIPVRISPDAEAFVAEQGFRGEFDEMLEHTKRAVPEVREVVAELIDVAEHEGGVDPRVMIRAVVRRHRPGDRPEWQWAGWAARTFEPRVLRLVCMDTTLDAPGHGR